MGAVACLNSLGLLPWTLRADEQLRVEWRSGTEVVNGPCSRCLLCPCRYRSARIVKAESLGALDYVKVKNSISGIEHIEKGPKQVFLGPCETVEAKAQAVTLGGGEYIYVENVTSGGKTMQVGPCVWFPGPHDQIAFKGQGIHVGELEYIRYKMQGQGKEGMQRGPCIWCPKPGETGTKHQSVTLRSLEYIIVEDTMQAQKRVVQGPTVWFPETHEIGSEIRTGWSLKAFEYIRLVNVCTGEIRTEKGEQIVIPNVDEELLDGKIMTAMKLKMYEFAEILDQSTGEVEIINGPTQFILGPYERVLREGNTLHKPHCQCASVHVLCTNPGTAGNAKPVERIASRAMTGNSRGRITFSNDFENPIEEKDVSRTNRPSISAIGGRPAIPTTLGHRSLDGGAISGNRVAITT